MSDDFKNSLAKLGLSVGAVIIGYFLYQRYNSTSKEGTVVVNDIVVEEEKHDTSVYLPDTVNGALQVNKGTLDLELIEKEVITHDTYNFVFKLPKDDQEFGLHLGGHVLFTATIPTAEHPEGELVSRKYTPISVLRQQGFVKFPIKVYRRNVHPQFPEGGVMSQYLETLNLGDKVHMTGPRGKLKYLGNANFDIQGKIGKRSSLLEPFLSKP